MRIQYVHSKNYLHRDLKPENFLIGLGKKEGIVHLIDYGLAKKYISSSTGTHIEYKETKEFVGAARYASLNAHLRKEEGRRDDLEAIGFILLYLLRGTLPWQGVCPGKGETLEKAICTKKELIPIAELCKEFPGKLINYNQFIRRNIDLYAIL
jgi:serine/threonine protein kinase